MSEQKNPTTAFIIVKDADGFYTALTDLTVDINPDNTATLQDVKIACIEILNSINQQEVIASVMSQLLKPTPAATEEEPVEEANVVTEEASE